MGKKVFLIILVLISINLVSSVIDIPFDDSNIPRVLINDEEPITTWTNTTVMNFSAYANCWTTIEGIKCDVSDIQTSELTNDLNWIDSTNVAYLNNSQIFTENNNFTGNISVDEIVMALNGTRFHSNRDFQQTAIIVTSEFGNQLILGGTNAIGKDFDHEDLGAPTLYIQSIKNPDNDNLEWIKLYHNQNSGIIEVGQGGLTLEADTTMTLKTDQKGDTFYISNTGDESIMKAGANDMIYQWYRANSATQKIEFKGENSEGIFTYFDVTGHNGATNNNDKTNFYTQDTEFHGDVEISDGNAVCQIGTDVATGEQPYLYLYGYHTGVGQKYARMYVNSFGRLIYDGTASEVTFLGMNLKLQDDTELQFGGNHDYHFEYLDGTKEFVLWTTNYDGASGNKDLMSIKDGTDDIVFTADVNITQNLTIGTSAKPTNITLYSQDGTKFTCGVSNGGTFSCS